MARTNLFSLDSPDNNQETTRTKLFDVAGDVVDSVAGAVESGVEVASNVGETVSSIYETVTNPGFGTSQARAYLSNFLTPGADFTEDMLDEGDKSALIDVVKSARKANRDYLTYKDFGTTNTETLNRGFKESFSDPTARMAHLVGSGGEISVDAEGNTIVTDLYDFNPGPKRIAFWDKLKNGEVDMDAIGDANPIELLSMLAYAAQEQRKSKGKPADSKIVFNLGKLE